jgi:hypothetical protein
MNAKNRPMPPAVASITGRGTSLTTAPRTPVTLRSRNTQPSMKAAATACLYVICMV